MTRTRLLLLAKRGAALTHLGVGALIFGPFAVVKRLDSRYPCGESKPAQ